MESNLILYTSDNGDVSIQVRYEDGTFGLLKNAWQSCSMWAWVPSTNILKVSWIRESYRKMQLFGIFRIVQNEDTRQVTREVAFYPLDAIIAVGYRVNSEQATYFRKWATKVLNSFITKGYVLDKQRLKQGEQFGHDYFILLSAKLLGKSLTCCHPNYCVSMSRNEDFYV